MRKFTVPVYLIIFASSSSIIVYQQISRPARQTGRPPTSDRPRLTPPPKPMLPGIPEGPKTQNLRNIMGFIDTGVDQDHPQLKGLIAHYRDFTGEGLDDDHGHGTRAVLVAVATYYQLIERSPSTKNDNDRPVATPAPGIAMAKVVGLKPVSAETMEMRKMAAMTWLGSLNPVVVNVSLGD